MTQNFNTITEISLHTENYIRNLIAISFCPHTKSHMRDLIPLQPILKAHMLMLFNGFQKSYQASFQSAPCLPNENPLQKALQWALWRFVMSLVPCLKRRPESVSCAGEHREPRQLMDWNPSHCYNEYNYAKKRAVRFNYPWYSPPVMT